MEKYFDIELPKWSLCRIEGNKITEEQAMNIILRTDCFFSNDDFFSNDRQFDEKAKKLFEQPMYKDFDSNNFNESWNKFENALHTWSQKYIPTKEHLYNTLDSLYLVNSWIATCYIGGPHGWCRPDGVITYSHNIGKYPSVSEVYNELKVIAEKWKFLDFKCTLFNGEECEYIIRPLVTMVVKNGEISFSEEHLSRYSKILDLTKQYDEEHYWSLEELQKIFDKYFNVGD